jgi:hypothetical protein
VRVLGPEVLTDLETRHRRQAVCAERFLRKIWSQTAILNFTPGGKLLPQGRICPPGVNFVPWGRSYPLGVKFSVCPSILPNNRECSSLGPGMNEGVNIPPRGQILPLGAKFTPRGEVIPSGPGVKLRMALWSLTPILNFTPRGNVHPFNHPRGEHSTV